MIADIPEMLVSAAWEVIIPLSLSSVEYNENPTHWLL